MQKANYMSSTYLRVILQGNQDLAKALMASPDLEIIKALEQDFISAEKIEQAFAIMAQQGVESWLLSYGQSVGVTAHGPLGYAILSAPDLQTALTVLADYSVIRSSLSSIKFSHRGNRAQIILNDHSDDPLTQRWLLENVVYTILSLIENITAHPIGNTAKVTFTWPAPSYANQLAAVLGVECQYNADCTGLSIPSSWRSIRSPLHDEQSFRSNLAKCRELKLRFASESNLVDSAKLHLQNYFEQRLAGQATAEELPSLEDLAERHFMSARTFNRRLSDLDSNYRGLLEEVRQEQAIDLLSRTHLTANKISYYLAYQEPANFNRAFKRWFATTPAAWRANRQ